MWCVAVGVRQAQNEGIMENSVAVAKCLRQASDEQQGGSGQQQTADA